MSMLKLSKPVFGAHMGLFVTKEKLDFSSALSEEFSKLSGEVL